MNTNTSPLDALARVLRLAVEPCVHYPEQIIHHALMNRVNEFMNVLEQFYFEWAGDHAAITQPPKQVFTRAGTRGDWRAMPCTIASDRPLAGKAVGSIDAVKIIGTNEEECVVADKISVGKALLLHPTDHFVEAIFDVAALSSFRTAAISVLAFTYCGYRPDHVAGIIGAGRVGFYTAVILREWLDIECLLVSDVNDVRVRDFSEVMTAWYGTNVRVAAPPDVRREGQALFLSTTSRLPLIDGRLERHVPFISSVGADADNLSELAPDVLEDRMLVSESRDNLAFGDLRRWHDAGLIRSDDLVLLPTLMANAVQSGEVPARAVFISTGTAVQDALVCRFLHDRLNGRGGLPLHECSPAPR